MSANDFAFVIGAVYCACLAGFTASVVATSRRARHHLTPTFPTPPMRQAGCVRVVRLIDWEAEGWLR